MNELAIRQNDDYSSLMALAKELVTTGFLPVAVKTPAQAVAIILTGRELGLPPMQSLRSICIIQGKPELSADLQLSIFHRDGGRSKWVTLTTTEATLWLKHPNGDEHTESFSMEDAKKAGLAGGQNWQKYPKAMLRSRAITAGMKSIGFEPLTGTYSPGEIGGPETVDPDPINSYQLAQGSADATPPPSASTPTPAPPPVPPPKAKAKLKEATANTRSAALARLGCQEEGPAKNFLHSYLVALGWLENEKSVEQWPVRFVPLSAEELEAVRAGLTEFSTNGVSVMPYQPHGLDPSTLQSTPVDPPKPAVAEWKKFIVPFGLAKGHALGDLPADDLEWYLKNFQVREVVDGNPVPPESIASQKALRAALDEAAATKKG